MVAMIDDIDTCFRGSFKNIQSCLSSRFTERSIIIHDSLRMTTKNPARLIMHGFELRWVIKIWSRRTLIWRQRTSIWKFDNISFQIFCTPAIKVVKLPALLLRPELHNWDEIWYFIRFGIVLKNAIVSYR